jgi:hypothetical protein
MRLKGLLAIPGEESQKLTVELNAVNLRINRMYLRPLKLFDLEVGESG